VTEPNLVPGSIRFGKHILHLIGIKVHSETIIARGESGCDRVGFAPFLRFLSLMFKLKDWVGVSIVPMPFAYLLQGL
jgi:hypothetical protein